MDEEKDDLRKIPGSDAVHYVILRRVEQLERSHTELDRWRTKVDIMLENVQHLEARFDAAMEKQTSQIITELTLVKTDLGSVLKDQTFWANSRTIARWIIGVSATATAAAWAVFSFVYEHHGKK